MVKIESTDQKWGEIILGRQEKSPAKSIWGFRGRSQHGQKPRMPNLLHDNYVYTHQPLSFLKCFLLAK